MKEYDYSKNGAYFITICTKDRECILSHIPVGTDAHIGPQKTVGTDAHIGPRVELTQIGKIAEKYILSMKCVDCYVVMPNHIHLIIILNNDSNNQNISNAIRSYKILVSKEIGKSIFQSSFYDHIIRDYNDYMIRVRYIQENPVKWAYDPYHKDL